MSVVRSWLSRGPPGDALLESELWQKITEQGRYRQGEVIAECLARRPRQPAGCLLVDFSATYRVASNTDNGKTAGNRYLGGRRRQDSHPDVLLLRGNLVAKEVRGRDRHAVVFARFTIRILPYGR
jgi:hypothetical protein